MFDNQIMAVIVPQLTDALAQWVVGTNYAVERPIVKQSFQPTQQGVPTAPTVFIHKIMDNRFGFPQEAYKWNEGLQRMVNTTTEIMRTTYQVNALFIQDPANTVQLTAGDLVNASAQILQSDFMVEILRENGIGLERVTQITTTYFQDDRDRHETSPSFDFTITHKNITIRHAPIVSTIEEGIFPI